MRKHRASKQLLLFGSLLLFLLGFGFASAHLLKIGLQSRVTSGGAPRTLTGIQQISRMTKLTLPATSVLIDGEYSSGLSPYLIAKVRMSHKNVAQFLAQQPLRGHVSTQPTTLNEKNMPRMRARGWRLSSAQRVLSADGIVLTSLTNNADALWLTVDLDNPNFAVVYVYYQN